MGMDAVAHGVGIATGSPLIINGLNKAVQSMMRSVWGSGDYFTEDAKHNGGQVAQNSFFKGANASANISFDAGGFTLRLQHRDYIKDVVVPVNPGYSVSVHHLNPGLAAEFPFGEPIANNYSTYRFNGLIYELISEFSPIGSSTSNGIMGSYGMSFNPNSDAPPFVSKTDLLNSGNAISGPPYKSLLFGVECKDQPSNGYYVRSGVVTTPINLTDMGTMQLYTDFPPSFPAGGKVAELWVTYDVSLRVPHISSAEFGYAHFSRSQHVTEEPVGYGAAEAVPPILLGVLTNSYIDPLDAVYGDGGSFVIPDAIVGDIFQMTVIQDGLNGCVPTNYLDTSSSIGVQNLFLINGEYSSSAPGDVSSAPMWAGGSNTYVRFFKVDGSASEVRIGISGQYFSELSPDNLVKVSTFVVALGYNLPVL